MRTASLAVAQMGATKDVEANTRRVLSTLERARKQRVDILVLPECILSGYMYGSREEGLAHAIGLGDQTVLDLQEACREAGLYLIAGLLEAGSNGALFNSALMIGADGHILACYRKSHLPCLGVDRFVDPGPEPPPVVETVHGRIGIAICYDLRFPESMRTLALNGAQLVAQPSTWPREASMLADHFVPVRACENRVFVAVANRPDSESGVPFMGRSQVADPNGAILIEADDDGEVLLSTAVSLDSADDKNIINTPGEYEVSLFDDRRPELYESVTIANSVGRRAS